MDFKQSLSKITKELSKFLDSRPKLLILGIGENRMGDDGLGQYISFYLDQQDKYSNIKIINGGIVPEERYGEIIDFSPSLIILIDAVDSGSKPGTIKFYENEQMKNFLPISSHSLPLPILVDRCKRDLPGVSIKLLGIQPKSLEFLDSYVLFQEDLYSLDEKEQNPNIPFYAFNLSDEIQDISKAIVKSFTAIFHEFYELMN